MLIAAPPKCPFCEGDSKKLFSKNEVPINECLVCTHRFVSTDTQVSLSKRNEEQFGDDYFFGGEGCYEDYSIQAPELSHKGGKYSRLLKRLLPSGSDSKKQAPRVLDIGSAAGYLLQGFVDNGWQGTGVEANGSMARFGREELGLDVRHSTVEEFDSDQKYDAATMVQVLPHLVNPSETLDSVRSQLSKNGLLLIETWSCRSLTARAFGKSWHEYNPPSVLHWFSRGSLGRLLREHNFEVVKQGRPLKWIHVGNGAAIFKQSMEESFLKTCAMSVLDRVPASLKVPYFLDDVFWVVARKCD